MKLHLGVIDIPYAGPASDGKRNAPKSEVKTTGDVADILEAKYNVMRVFFELHDADIAKTFEDALKGQLENVLLGAPSQPNPYGTAESDIQSMFKRFISAREIERIGVPGVPTQAAKDGVNHRLKSGHGRRRPSFRDTGLYQSSFRAWIEE